MQKHKAPIKKPYEGTYLIRPRNIIHQISPKLKFILASLSVTRLAEAYRHLRSTVQARGTTKPELSERSKFFRPVPFAQRSSRKTVAAPSLVRFFEKK